MASGFAGLLQAAAGPIAKKVLSALGIGVVTYTALQTSFNLAKSAVVSSYGAITGEIAGILGLAGFGTAIGIVLGAMAARVTYMQLTKLAKVAS